MGRHHNPTVSEMFDQMKLERIEKVITDSQRQETEIAIRHIPIYDHQAARNRQRERDREHTIGTARLAEIARLEARDEYEARKQASTPTPASDATPVVSDGPSLSAGNESAGPGWTLTMPKRFQGYGKPLYDYLKTAHDLDYVVGLIEQS